MSPDRCLYQRKTEPGAVHALLMSAPSSIEPIEDSPGVVAMNADAFVAHFYTNVSSASRVETPMRLQTGEYLIALPIRFAIASVIAARSS